MSVQEALVLERQGELSLRPIELPSEMGPLDVRIRIHAVGICGSDVHYYTHGHIGDFVVKQPMVLGHEAAGVVTEVGSAVSHLKVGDRVCMEPGVPCAHSRASRLGVYNVDPDVRFWATPPVHGCMTDSVVHPASFTYKIPEHMSFAEGAMIEPFAIGVQAAVKAQIKPGDTCVVIGSGTIGLMIALAALGAGAGKVLVSDVMAPKLAIAAGIPNVIPVDVRSESLRGKVDQLCGKDWGADVVFEASGSARAYGDLLSCVRPAGTVVLVGMPVSPVSFDVVAAQAKEIRIETVFRYANVYDRAIELVASGKVDLKPLLAATFPFKDAIKAFERAAQGLPADIKLMIEMPVEG